MKLIIEIPDEDYKKINSKEKIITISCDIASAIKNGTPIPDNATNGNSVIKIFYKGIVRISSRKNVSVEFNKDWWNAPYQKGGK